MNPQKTYTCRIKVKKTCIERECMLIWGTQTQIWGTNSDGEENLNLNSKIDMYREGKGNPNPNAK